MSRRIRIGLVVAVAFMAIVAGAAYAWDSSQSDTIAAGVSIAGVDVGDLTRKEATRKLEKQLAKPLDKPVRAKFDGVTYKLDPADLDFSVDIDSMVDAAVDAGREQALPSRVWRLLTGSKVNRHIGAEVEYADEGISDFRAELETAINREATDASVDPSGSGINLVKAVHGRTLDTRKLESRLAAALVRPDRRRITLVVDETKPEVTKKDLAADYPGFITVDRENYKLRYWENLELVKEYPIAVGAIGRETPEGQYTIQNMAVDPVWHVPDSDWAGDLAGEVIPADDPRNAIKSRWMGIYDGVGIHGTNDTASLGSAASHGCIRMDIPDVQELYDLVSVGDAIYIG